MSFFTAHGPTRIEWNVVHDFGSGGSVDGPNFVPAKLRGKASSSSSLISSPVSDSPQNATQPLEFGDEERLVQVLSDELRSVERLRKSTPSVSLSADGKRLATITQEIITVFNSHTWQVQVRLIHSDPVISAEFTHDGRKLLVQCKEPLTEEGPIYEGIGEPRNLVKLWDLEKEAAHQASQSTPVPATSFPSSAANIADELVNTAQRALTVRNGWTPSDVSSEVVTTLRQSFQPTIERLLRSKEFARAELIPNVRHMDGSRPWSMQGDRLLFARWAEPFERPNELIVWDLGSRKEVLVLTGPEDYISWAGFSPDGKKIAATSYDCFVRIWDAHTGQLAHTLGNEFDAQL